jgi:exopolysaccharide production protein ExoZ
MKKLFDKIFLLNDRSRISALDGVRGLSIIFVLFFHYNPSSLYFLYGGHMGVDIFFVLSGFFIASILFNSKNTNTNYLKNRFLRLMPAYTISLLIIWLLHYNVSNSYKGFIANLFFIPFFSKKIEYINFVSWTLAWEWLFYLIAFLLFKINKLFNFKYFHILIISILIISTVFLNLLNIDYEIYRFVGFYLGCLIYLTNIKINNRYVHYISFTIILLLITAYGYFNETLMSGSFKILYYFIFDIFVSIFLVTLLHQESYLKYIFQSKPFLFLGKISYSFYLTHAMIGIYFSTLLTNYFHFNFYISCLSALLISIFISSLFFIISERPYFVYKLRKRNDA